MKEKKNMKIYTICVRNSKIPKTSYNKKTQHAKPHKGCFFFFEVTKGKIHQIKHQDNPFNLTCSSCTPNNLSTCRNRQIRRRPPSMGLMVDINLQCSWFPPSRLCWILSLVLHWFSWFPSPLLCSQWRWFWLPPRPVSRKRQHPRPLQVSRLPPQAALSWNIARPHAQLSPFWIRHLLQVALRLKAFPVATKRIVLVWIV